MTPEFAEPVRATERMVVAWRQTPFARRTWFTVTLAVIFAAHAAVIAVLLWHDEPVAAARVEETPVEVVAEMPEPPAPKQPAPKPVAAAQQPPEKPATSAPRAQNDETTERDSGESETRSPKAKVAEASPPPNPQPAPDKPQPEKVQEAKLEAKPQQSEAEPPKPDPPNLEPPKPEVSKAEEKPADAKPEDKAEAAAPPEDRSDAEALDKATPEPPRRPAALAARPVPPKPPARPARLAIATPQPLPQALPTAIDQLAGSSDLPDYVFAKPQRKTTKYKGGSEDNRYLAIVYAMVTQSHEAVALPGGDWQVAVAFQVDGHGSLVGIGLTQSSGYPEVDAAAIDAVRRAAPFPPPPSGALTGLIARLNAAHARAAMARGR